MNEEAIRFDDRWNNERQKNQKTHISQVWMICFGNHKTVNVTGDDSSTNIYKLQI